MGLFDFFKKKRVPVRKQGGHERAGDAHRRELELIDSIRAASARRTHRRLSPRKSY